MGPKVMDRSGICQREWSDRKCLGITIGESTRSLQPSRFSELMEAISRYDKVSSVAQD